MSDELGPPEPRGRRPAINARTLWAGGAATAVVAALIILVGVLVVRGLLDTTVYPSGDGLLGSQLGSLMLYAALAALAATGLAHALMEFTPRALSFFSWIMALLTVIVTLAPFTVDTSWASRIGSSAIYLVTGIAITSLVSGAAARPRRAASQLAGRRRDRRDRPLVTRCG